MPGPAVQPYLPRLVLEWDDLAPGRLHQALAGSMVFVDVSGFTKMSERLARHGKVGAEEVTEVIGNTFDRLVAEAYAYGASLLKFGGDALLLFFQGDSHHLRACAAAHRMRKTLRDIGRFATTAGWVQLRMSVGVHSGIFDFFLVGDSHRELIVAGPAATETTLMESAASAGQIVVSAATAALLPSHNVGRRLGPGFLLAGTVEGAVWSEIEPPQAGPDLTKFIPRALRESLLSGHVQPEHRPAAVGFIHFMEFDRVVETAGTDAAGEALHRLVRTVQTAADSRGVAFLSSDIAGDGGKIILTAGVPVTTGDDEEQILLALREVVSADLPLPVQVGVNRGPVFAGEVGPAYRKTYTVMGDTVNLAARLMANAPPGVILTVEEVLGSSRTTFKTEALPPFYVKGKKKPVQAFSVWEPEGSRVGSAGAGLPLVGRDAELLAMLDAWESTKSGSGRLVELVAEPGLGKSRLLEEFLARAGASRVVRAECRLYQAAVPYYPFRALLRQAWGLEGLAAGETEAKLRTFVEETAPEQLPWLSLVGVLLDLQIPGSPEVAQLVDQFRPARTAEAVRALLQASIAVPTIWVVEDTHWIDEASRDLLIGLISGIEERSWMLCLTRRPEAKGFFAPDEPWVIRVALQPLGQEQAKALIIAATEETPLLPQRVAALAERAEGHPLFLLELLQALRRGSDVEALPHSVEGLIGARIDKLPPADRTSLRQVAVLGAGFGMEHMPVVLAESYATDIPRVISRLSDFLTSDPSGWVRFNHALFRDVAYEGLPFRTRMHLHGQVGDSIRGAAGDAPEDQAALLSLHYFFASRWDDAWHFSKVAGDRAKEIYANGEAAGFYARAADAARKVNDIPPPDVAVILEALGDVTDRAGDSKKADSAYRSARRLLAGDPVGEARLLWKQAWIRERVGRYSQALQWARRGHRTLEGIDGGEAAKQRVRLSNLRAALRLEQGHSADAIGWCHQAIVDAKAVDDKDALAHAYMLLGLALEAIGDPECAHYSQMALSIYEELENLAQQSLVLNHLGVFAYFEGRWNEAIGFYERSRAAGTKTGDPINAERGTINIGEILSDQGHFQAAEERFEHVFRVWKAAGYRAGYALALSDQGRLASRSGRFESAYRLLNRARTEFEDVGDLASVLEVDSRIAEYHIYQGEAPQALSVATDALKRAASLEVTEQVALLHRLRAQSLIRLEQLQEAQAALEESLRVARERKADFEAGLSLRALAQLARLTGSTDPEAERESESILQELGVIFVPDVPGLPGIPQPVRRTH